MINFDDLSLYIFLFLLPVVGIYIFNKLWCIAIDGAIQRWREYRIQREELYLESVTKKIEHLINIYIEESKKK